MLALSICDGLFHMTSTVSAVISWFCGAVVSYVLSRWAWERKGKPDVLRETIPFWVISAVVVVVLSLATKLGYKMALAMHVHSGFKHVLIVEGAYFIANVVTFVLRFLIFHYVLFTDRTAAARAAATGPDLPEGVQHPAEAPSSASYGVTAESGFGGAAASAAYPEPARVPGRLSEKKK
ncbi:MAG: GtrA family protein [Streptosporangiales bacterium]|jgi:putative flippase GtrA|nr:GtrA family protein [Streptosporangiales bacterium]